MLAAVIALATLGEYFFGWRLGVDQFLLRPCDPRRSLPVRPAFEHRLGGARSSRERSCSWTLRLGVGGQVRRSPGRRARLGLLALAGTATGTTSLGDLATGQAIATTTALGLVMLSGATSLARLDHGAVALFSSSERWRRAAAALLPSLSAAPWLAGLAPAGKDAGLYGVRVGRRLMRARSIAILATLAWALAVVIERRSAERLAQHAFLAMSQTSTDAVVTVDGQGSIDGSTVAAKRCSVTSPTNPSANHSASCFPSRRVTSKSALRSGPLGINVTYEDPVEELRILRGRTGVADRGSRAPSETYGERWVTGVFRDISARRCAEDRFRGLLKSAGRDRDR